MNEHRQLSRVPLAPISDTVLAEATIPADGKVIGVVRSDFDNVDSVDLMVAHDPRLDGLRTVDVLALIEGQDTTVPSTFFPASQFVGIIERTSFATVPPCDTDAADGRDAPEIVDPVTTVTSYHVGERS